MKNFKRFIEKYEKTYESKFIGRREEEEEDDDDEKINEPGIRFWRYEDGELIREKPGNPSLADKDRLRTFIDDDDWEEEEEYPFIDTLPEEENPIIKRAREDSKSDEIAELSETIEKMFELSNITGVSVYGNKNEINIYVELSWIVDIEELANIYGILHKIKTDVFKNYESETCIWSSKGKPFIMTTFSNYDEEYYNQYLNSRHPY